MRLSTFVLALLASASIGFWLLKWQQPGRTDAPVPALPAPQRIDSQQLAQLLGAGEASVAAPVVQPSTLNQYKLLGVIAQGSQGSALIALEGTTAKPYRVGAALDDRLVLHSVARRSAHLAASLDGPIVLTLELPAPASTAGGAR